MEATEKDGDPSDLWLTLEAMGYNQALELVEASSTETTVLSKWIDSPLNYNIHSFLSLCRSTNQMYPH